MIARHWFLVLTLALIVAASLLAAQENPPAGTAAASQPAAQIPRPLIPTTVPAAPASQPETARQHLARAIDVTNALAPKAVTIGPDGMIQALPPSGGATPSTVRLWAGTVDSALSPDRGPGGLVGRADTKNLRFPQHRDVMPYLNSRPWAMSYIVDRWVRTLIPPTVPTWPTADDADELARLVKDTDPAVRGLAVEALAALGRPQDIPTIAELLADDHDALPGLSPNVSMSATEQPGDGASFDKAVNPVDAATLKFSWHDREVKDYAALAIYLMTGENMSAKSFAAWWPTHKDASNCAWYWLNRFRRESELAMLDAWRMERAETKPATNPTVALKSTINRAGARKAAMDAVLLDLDKCPKETQAKVRLMCNPDSGIGVDLTPLANLISRDRALELLERKNLWPDLEWEFSKKDGRDNSNIYLGNLQSLTDGIASQAVKLFRPEDAPRLLAIRDHNLADKLHIGQSSLTVAASRLMPPARADKLDDPATRDGLLRSVLAARQPNDVNSLLGDDSPRAAAAQELINIALPVNWKFLKAQFFREMAVYPGSAPEPRWAIMYCLGNAPLTAGKRAALIDLLSDSRCDALITGGPAVIEAWGLTYPAVEAVNRYAGKDILPPSIYPQLADPKTSPAALAEFRKAIAELKSMPLPTPATRPAHP